MTTLKPVACAAMVLFLCLIQSYSFSQEKSKVQFGKVTPADFILPPSSAIDTNTNAVILSDIGSVHFVGNNFSAFSYVYQRQKRIKLLNKRAFADLASIAVLLRTGEADFVEKLGKVSASTYNLENGQVVETKLNKTDIFETRENKWYLVDKFTLPAVKDNSIIEYTYTITSPFEDEFPSWEFQSKNYPSLWSEFQIDVPQTLLYVLVKQGIHAYTVDKGSEGHESFSLTQPADSRSYGSQPQNFNISSATVIHRWVMKDIPAFHEEEFLSTPANYIDKIEFQLSGTYNGETYTDHKNSWKRATEELLNNVEFGGALDQDDALIGESVAQAAGSSSDPLEKAKGIYYYITSHFTCDNYYNFYLRTNFRDVIKKNSGSVGDINLLLITMLRKKGFHAEPVVLSTREFGYNLVTYPMLKRLNYVIARLKIDGKVYYLDAAHPQLGFGQLPGNCYNGHARIISNTDSGSVYFYTDSLKEKKTTLVILTNTDKGMEGSFQATLGPEESYLLRRQLGVEKESEYFKHIQASFGDDLDLSNGGVDSLTKPEDPVKVHYDFRMNQTAGASPIYLNPMWWDNWRENPFKAAERKYPVEMPYLQDEMYVFSMDIPDGYVLDEMPKSARVALNENQGSFEYLIGQQGNMIQLRCHLKLNKATFSPDDYSTLRDFYAYVVKKEAETIVLKKK
jgi:transglutaminase-like putative cysteine protease